MVEGVEAYAQGVIVVVVDESSIIQDTLLKHLGWRDKSESPTLSFELDFDSFKEDWRSGNLVVEFGQAKFHPDLEVQAEGGEGIGLKPRDQTVDPVERGVKYGVLVKAWGGLGPLFGLGLGGY